MKYLLSFFAALVFAFLIYPPFPARVLVEEEGRSAVKPDSKVLRRYKNELKRQFGAGPDHTK